MLLVHIVNKYNIICMYPVQNNNITAQAVGEEVEIRAINVCTQSSGSGRIRYHFYSNGTVYKEIRMLSGERTRHEMNMEEINTNESVMRTRDRVLKAAEKFKQTGNTGDLYNF